MIKDMQFDGYRGRLCLLSSLNLFSKISWTVTGIETNKANEKTGILTLGLIKPENL